MDKIKVLPQFTLMNQLEVATHALSAFTADESGADPFIYYLSGSAFYKYSANGDGMMPLAWPNVAPATVLSICYTKRRGFHTRVLSATSNTVTIGGLRGPVLNGETIRILQGVGAGQEKVLTWVSDNIHDSGVITGTAAASSLADTTKKWKINQWAGYLVHVQFGTDASQAKRILYNDTTTLYVADANLMPQNPWENQVFAAIAPYALPTTTAGSQTHYQICSQTFNVDTAWKTIPDATSFATALTGGIYLVSSAAATPFFTFQYYDCLADNWVSKTCPQGLIVAALGTDVSLERTAKVGTALASGTSSAISAKGLVDAAKSFEVDRYRNCRVLITGGTGNGQNRRITCNTATALILARAWDITPDATSTYEIWPDFDRIYMAGNGSSAIFANSPENDYWMQGQAFDDGVTANIACTMKGWTALGVTSGARLAAGVTGVNAVPTAAGSNYLVGDVLTCSVGGTGAQVIVTSVNTTGGVTGIELMNAGTATGFTVGTGRATTGGTGTGCTIEITSIGVVCKITTPTNHWFRTGQKVTFAGCTDALYNAEYTILCANGLTTFDIVTTAAASMAATASQSTTVIVDPTKSWGVNEHAGRLVHVMVAGIAPTSQVRMVISNTAVALTVAAITAAVNGTSKYVIYDSKPFGVAELNRATNQKAYGHASGGSTSTLIDASKNWRVNQWAGYKMRVEAGTGYGSGVITILNNTANTITYAVQTFTPDATTHYEIQETWGIASASTTTSITEATYKNWVANCFAGKRVKLTGGTGIGQEASITSNTGTALTTGTITAGDATTTYGIFEHAVRGAGIKAMFLWGVSVAGRKAKFIMLARGGATNVVDFYNISTERFEDISMFISPQQATFTAGTMWAYDGGDYVYINALNYILRYNTKINKVDLAHKLHGTHYTAIIGNRMEIIADGKGNKYLYVAQHTGTILWRAALIIE